MCAHNPAVPFSAPCCASFSAPCRASKRLATSKYGMCQLSQSRDYINNMLWNLGRKKVCFLGRDAGHIWQNCLMHIDGRLEIFRRDELCLRCAKKNHCSSECTSQEHCPTCKDPKDPSRGAHHHVICYIMMVSLLGVGELQESLHCKSVIPRSTFKTFKPGKHLMNPVRNFIGFLVFSADSIC